MLVNLSLIVLGIMGVVVMYLWLLPNRINVHRKEIINASKSEVFEWILNFEKWPKWSPWLIHDEKTELTYSDIKKAEGSSFYWKSAMIGEGMIKHRHIQVDKKIIQELRFIKPFRSRADVQFDLNTLEDGQTEVTWRMTSKLPWFMSLMLPTFREGISNDLALGLGFLSGCVHPEGVFPRLKFIGEVPFPSQRILSETYIGSIKGLKQFRTEAFARLLKLADIHRASGPLLMYKKINKKKTWVDCIAAITVTDSFHGAQSQIIPSGKYFLTRYMGDDRFLPAAWNSAEGQVRMRKFKKDPSKWSFEMHFNDPKTVKTTNEIIIDLYIPIQDIPMAVKKT